MEQKTTLNTMKKQTNTGRPTFKVISPGPLTSVQDLGRLGKQMIGVPYSGALDEFSFKIGNILLEQDGNCAGIEITFMGPKIEILANTLITICGADTDPEVNGKSIPLWKVFKVKKGDILSFKYSKKMLRSYLLVLGGIDVPLVMDSRSTFFRISTGGLAGRALKANDVINVFKNNDFSSEGNELPSELVPNYSQKKAVRVILGNQHEYFDENLGIATFLNSEYQISTESNREGARLIGPAIKIKEGMPESIPSEAFPKGGIQVTPNGQPIIILNDSIGGGYAKIAHIITPDINRIVQMLPKTSVNFNDVSLKDAHQIYKEYIDTFVKLTRLFSNRSIKKG